MKTRLRGVKENLDKKKQDDNKDDDILNKDDDKPVGNKRVGRKQTKKEEEKLKNADKENDEQKKKIKDQSPEEDKPIKKKAVIPKKGSKKADADDGANDDSDKKKAADDKKGAKSKKSRARSNSKAKSDDEDGNKAQKKDEKEPAKLVTAILKGGRAVDSFCPIKDKVHVYSQNNKFYDSTLNQSNVTHNNNKFYIIQVLQSDTNTSQFYSWNRWGRVGVAGQNALKGPVGKDIAIDDYEKKLHEKTVRGDYRVLDIVMEEETKDDDKKDDKSMKDENSKDDQKKTESKLPKTVQELINLIFDMKMMNQQMKEIGYDAKKMPLGKLSKSNIEKGYKILADIVEALKSRTPSARSQIESLSNDFYSYIPHDVGFQKMQAFILDNNDKVRKKLEMLQSLSDIQIATKLLEQVQKADNQIDSNYEKLGCKLVPIDPTSKTFEIVSEYVKNTHATTHSSYALEIIDLFEVDREEEKKRYKSDIHNKLLLWHGSRLTNWVGILSQGLRIAPPEAPVTGYMFGKGVYFADMVSKSANYCFTTRENNISCMLLCEVALGNMNEKLHADYNASNLPNNKHSTKGCGSTAPSEKSYVDLDGVKVPVGKGEPTPFQGALMYNEFIVYDVAQIKMKYLLKMKFKYK